MREEENMNKTDFITRLHKSAEKMTKKQLLLLLYDISLEVPEYQRETFLEQVEAFRKKPVRTEEMSEQMEERRKRAESKLDARIKKMIDSLEAVDQGDYRIIMDEYEDWDSWEGRMNDGWVTKFEETDEVNEVFAEAILLIHECLDGEYFQKAVDLFEKICAVSVYVDNEYTEETEKYEFDELDFADFINVDLTSLCRDVLIASYHVNRPEDLPQVFYEYYTLRPFRRVRLSMVFSQKDLEGKKEFLNAFEQLIKKDSKKEEWQKKLLCEIRELV